MLFLPKDLVRVFKNKPESLHKSHTLFNHLQSESLLAYLTEGLRRAVRAKAAAAADIALGG